MDDGPETWIQGGPLREVSFLKEPGDTRSAFIRNVQAGILQLKIGIEVVSEENELDRLITEFEHGFYYDACDKTSELIHLFPCRALVHLERTRRCNLRIQQLSQRLMEVTFGFFGSIWDAPDWNQVGVSEKERPQFKQLLIDLYGIFEFPIGTVGFEMDADCLFPTENSWPNDYFTFDKLSLDFIGRKRNDYLWILVDSRFLNAANLVGSIKLQKPHNAVLLNGSIAS